MRSSILLIALAPFSILSGCSKESPTSATASPTVENPGAEPRTEFASHAASSEKRSLEVNIILTTGFAAEDGTQAERTVSPILGKLSFEPSGTDAADYRLLGAAMEDTPMDATLKGEWAQALELLGHSAIHGTVSYDRTGRPTNNDCSMPPAKSSNLARQYVESMKSVFDLFVVPLPETELGVGAILRDSRAIEFSGLNLELDAKYTLTAIHDDALEFDAELSMRGLPQVIELPSTTKKGAQAQLLGATSTGIGKIRVPRELVGPGSGNLAIDIAMDLRMMNEGKEMRMRSTSRMQYELRGS